MRSVVIATAAAAAIVAVASSTPARAMTVGTASAIEAALADSDLVQEAAYVCRHRFYTSRRLCWWRPGYGYRGWRWRRR
jgi:hypothetical protein